MGPTPSGTVTFLFTDIEGSTRLWEDDPEQMRPALAEHDDIVRGAIETHGGYVFSTGGDGFGAAFSRAADAVDAANKAQLQLADHQVIRVRMGIHTGEVQERDGDYFGPAVNRAARLMALAHGGQVLVSTATEALLDDSVERRDLGAHRLRDLTRAEHVFQLGNGQYAPLQSIDAVPSNLPTVLTDLIGRSKDIAVLSELVATERIVTLTGTGGVGKTRLAMAVAAAVAGEFPDGAWLVELAPVSDRAGVIRATATALGVAATVGADQATVVEYLSGRRLVLVLDNCEHVLDEAADLVDAIVAAAPEAHIVATSREPLGVEGEVVRRVRSLTVPVDDADPATVDTSDAVRMLVARGVAAKDDFALDATNRADVVEICRRLDGIPLAIELAAARLRGMTPTQIAERLDERFQLLSGARRAQERHRTLQAAVSWSYDLLDPDEQQLFRRLSIFPASFDLTAAHSVGDMGDPLDALLHLVDRSLVQHDATSGRYRLLETLRQYGTERAAEAGEADDIRERYVDYYTHLVAGVVPSYDDPRRYEEVARELSAEIDNIAVVGELLISRRRWRELHDLCVNARFFLISNLPASLDRWLDAAVAGGGCVDDQERTDALGLVAYNTVTIGSIERGARLGRESMALAERAGGHPSPMALFGLSMLATSEDRPADALECLAAAVRAAERHDRYTQIIMRAIWLGTHVQVHGWEGNEPAIDELLTETRQHPSLHAITLASLAAAAVLYSDQAQRVLPYLDDVDDALGDAAGLVNRGWVCGLRAIALIESDPRAGISSAAEALRRGDRGGSPLLTHSAVLTLAVLAARVDRIGTTERLCAHAGAFADFQAHAGMASLNHQMLAALAEAGVPIPATPQQLSRQELFALVAELEANR